MKRRRGCHLLGRLCFFIGRPVRLSSLGMFGATREASAPRSGLVLPPQGPRLRGARSFYRALFTNMHRSKPPSHGLRFLLPTCTVASHLLMDVREKTAVPDRSSLQAAWNRKSFGAGFSCPGADPVDLPSLELSISAASPQHFCLTSAQNRTICAKPRSPPQAWAGMQQRHRGHSFLYSCFRPPALKKRVTLAPAQLSGNDY